MIDQLDFKPKKDIEEYLNTDFNLYLYDSVNSFDYLSTFTPLEYLNLFYEQVEIFLANRDKPLTLANHLANLELKKRTLYHFLVDLLRYINAIYLSNNFGNKYDNQIKICLDFADKELQKISPYKDFNIVKSDSSFDFHKIKTQVEKIYEVREKIKYLITKKTEYLQKYGRLKKDGKFITSIISYDRDFLRKCDLQLNMLEKLNKLTDDKPSVSFEFENKFDHVDKNDVYCYFKEALFNSNMLSEEDLNTFLKNAFQDKKNPNSKFTLNKKHRTNEYIIGIFHKYYKDFAGSPRGTVKTKYIELLTNYFNDFDFGKVANNFRS